MNTKEQRTCFLLPRDMLLTSSTRSVLVHLELGLLKQISSKWPSHPHGATTHLLTAQLGGSSLHLECKVSSALGLWSPTGPEKQRWQQQVKKHNGHQAFTCLTVTLALLEP